MDVRARVAQTERSEGAALLISVAIALFKLKNHLAASSKKNAHKMNAGFGFQ
jgi:hypothetical protein